MSRSRLALATLATTVAVSGCSATGSPSGPGGPAATGAAAATGPAAAGGFPVSIDHAFGSTTIPARPQRIATVGWSDHDVVAALGQAPVGATKITWGGNAKGSTDWFDRKLAELGDPEVTRYDDTDGIPATQIAATRPDLILGVNSGMTQAEYATLSKIAPVVAYPSAPWSTPWETSLSTIGTALGRPQEAADLRRRTDALIDAGLAKHPGLKGRSVAWVSFAPGNASTISVYTRHDLRPRLLTRFGLRNAPTVEKLSAGTTQFSANLSAEKASTLDADVLVFYAERPADVDALRAHPLLSRIPPLKAGRYVASTDNTTAHAMSSPSPLSIPVAVEKFLPKLASAAGGAPAS